MRLIGTLNEESKARRFAAILEERNIKVRIEPTTEKDWESTKYGDIEFQIWIVDEEDLLVSKQYLEDFLEDPEQLEAIPVSKPPPPLPGSKRQQIKEEAQRLARQPNQIAKQSTSVITFYLITLCTCIFLWVQFHTVYPTQWPKYIPVTVSIYPKLQKQLLFDYPAKLEAADRLLLVAGGPEPLMNWKDLPEEERLLLAQYHSLHYWQGIYPHLLHKIDPKEEPAPDPAPLFEKIGEGEFWRLFTPALLHGDIFHILFNMIWLAVLGTQIEGRIGAIRYILLILVSAIFSNVSQYLMSGYNFLGFSGVVCAMIAFIWMRKKRAPWEGYLLQNSTIVFISIFIFGMFALQLASFFLEATTDMQLPGSIANTAHIVGGTVGAILASTPFGRWKSR
jgi:GlpG protein